jgi:hypothetical protein
MLNFQGSIVMVFLFGAIMIWGLVVAEHQQAEHDLKNQEVNGYVID